MHRVRLASLLVALSLLTAVPLSAQAPLAHLKSQPFNESYQDEAPVSGRVVAGVMVFSRDGGNALRLMPPADAAGETTCIRVMSRDGRYWSENEFEIPAALGPGPIALEYPSEHVTFLDGLTPRELAILSTRGECGQEGGSVYYLAGEADPVDDGAVINVFVNSGRAQSYLRVSVGGEQRASVRCQEIQEDRRTGFDTLCAITLAELGQAEQLDLTLLRRRYERTLPPTRFSLMLPVRN